jgi:CO/xanthine dehydrogenase Mo-binding subunit
VASAATELDRPGRVDPFSAPELRGRDKVTGEMRYTADIVRPNALWAAYVTSPVAYARIRSIDATAAKALEGVRAVITAADIGCPLFGRNLYDWPVLCYDVVRFIGDRVAAIAAETREIAEHAARLVEVEYEELRPILEAADALEPGAAVLHPERNSYFFKAFSGKEPPKPPHPNIQGIAHYRKGKGNLAGIFASAHRVFEHHYASPRQHAGYIEPRSTIVWFDDDGMLHVVTPNKVPFVVREIFSNITGLPKERITVEPSAVGGDFGGKGMTVDEFVCFYLAKATKRPVRYVETYTEELRNGPIRHRAEITLKTALDADGRIIGHHSKVLLNGGAYAGGKPAPELLPSNGYATVPYQIPNVEIDITNVYTNTLPTGHVRSPMGAAVYFAWEQHIDQMAQALGVDPLEFRLKNCVKHGDTFPTSEKIRHPNATLVLETLKEQIQWGSPVPAGRGRGIALCSWHVGGGTTSIKIALAADGSVEVLTGVADQGAGGHLVAQRIAAAALGIPSEQVAVRRGSTTEALFDAGAGASRVTNLVGGAAEVAARKLRAKIEEATGTTWRDGEFVNAVGQGASLAEIAPLVCTSGPLTVSGRYEDNHDGSHAADFNFVACCVDVDVDCETGAFEIVDCVLVGDVGRIINPVGHQGQIDGGFIYGLGNARMEEMPLDESGKVGTLSLGEYKLPTMMDIPPFRSVMISAEMGEGPYGVKAAGELGNIGVPAALANAVADAARIRLSEYPITAERIYNALALQSRAPA